MQAENRIGNEKARIRLRQNRDISEYQIRLRRELNEYQEELKKKLFGRVRELLKIYMKTGEYLESSRAARSEKPCSMLTGRRL